MLRGFKRKRILSVCWGMLMLAAAGWGFAQLNANRRVAPETLLPERSILLVQVDGAALHLPAYQKTAAYDAFEKSGLMDVLRRAGEKLQEIQPEGKEFGEIVNHLEEHGLSLAVAVEPPADGPPRPWGVIVVHEAGGNDEHVARLLELISGGRFEPQTEDRTGRKVTWGRIDNTPVEIGWWTEKSHLVIAVGLGAVDSAIAVAKGDQSNVTTSPLWKKLTTPKAGLERTMLGWFNFAPLKEMFGGMPIPTGHGDNPPTVSDALEALGLANLESVTALSGYKGRSLWSEVEVVAPGESKGLLALARQKSFSLTDLPALPQELQGLVATSFDWSAMFQVIEGIVGAIDKYIEPGALQDMQDGLAEVERELGVSFKKDILDTLGTLHVAYGDAAQGMFGTGFGVAVQLKNPAALGRSLNTLLERGVEQSNGEMVVRKHEKHGRTVVTLAAARAPVLTPAYCIDKNWLVLGLLPQAVETFLLRQDGKLPKWSPDAESKAALAELPQQFTSLTLVDPRPTYRLLMGLAPMFAGFVETGMKASGDFPLDVEFPLAGADLPPAEIVTQPMFVNAAVTVVENGVTRMISRQSAPGIPFLGGGSDSTTVAATTGILVALLLPAVQQAREAARRTQSKNNLKQLGLAMHNYMDVHGQFPEGVVPGSGQTPEESLSWLVPLLPFLEQNALYVRVHRDEGWQSFANGPITRTVIPTFTNPGIDTTKVEGSAVTHYVGWAGVGEDGPTLPVTDPKAGMFGHNRVTKLRDIGDGTSNTAMISEATADSLGPWTAGGRPTLRSLTAQPYVNGPDGIGGPSPGGFNVLAVDGSVRFVSEYVDPSVMEAIMTINGGEVVDF